MTLGYLGPEQLEPLSLFALRFRCTSVRPNSDSSNRRRIVRRYPQPKESAMNKIEDRRAALNDAPRLDAVRITGV